MDSKKDEITKMPTKAGYELLPPPEYQEDAGEPAPAYEDLEIAEGEFDEQPSRFSTGLFSCLANPMTVVNIALCTPCVFGSTSRLLAENPLNAEADHRNTNWWHVDTFLYTLLAQGHLEFLLGATRRGVIRKKLNIEGSCGNDWATHIFCGPCAIAQESQEVNKFRSRAQAAGFISPQVARYRDEQNELAESQL